MTKQLIKNYKYILKCFLNDMMQNLSITIGTNVNVAKPHG